MEAIPHVVKVAMDNMFKNASYNDYDPSSDYTVFHAWASAVNLLSISAVFDQGEYYFYEGETLDDLKQCLTVTANYDNGTSSEVSEYTLSGMLTEGTSQITVAYDGKSATFNVVVNALDKWVNGYNSANNNGLIKANYPFILAPSDYTYDYTKAIAALEIGVSVAGTLSVGVFNASNGITANTTADRTKFSVVETVNFETTGLQMVYLSTPIVLQQGYALALCKGTSDTAEWQFGPNGVDKKFYYINNSTNKYGVTESSLGVNVYTTSINEGSEE